MVMYARDARDPTYTVVIDGKTVGQVTWPTDLRVFGRSQSTVYLARSVRNRRTPMGRARGH